MVNDALKPPLVALYRGYKEVDSRRREFGRWREERPFWGGFLLIVGGFIAGYTPYVVMTEWLFRDGTAQLIGILGSFFATAVIMAGIGALLNPELSNLLGMVGITFTILATLVGNFGGLLIGTFFGIIGGALAIAWRRVDIYDRRRGQPRDVNEPRGDTGHPRAPPSDRQDPGSDGIDTDRSPAEQAAEDVRNDHS